MSNATDNPRIEVLKAGGSGVFTNYIYKAIPLAFDESMSYYETLAGLRDYLEETVIPTVNNNAEAVAELQGLYEELNEYVDNYFKNLDVQEEINNKLDELVENGTLTRLIGEYVQPLIDEQNEKISNMEENIDNQNENINALTSRMNSFVTLKDGSTTGDAEIIDARVGANGQQYVNLGQAIRSQIDGLFNESSNYIKRTRTINLFNKYEAIKGYGINPNAGNIFESATRYASNYIPVTEGHIYYFSGYTNVAFYDTNKNFISGSTLTSYNITAPTNAAYMRTAATSQNNTLNIDKFVVYDSTETGLSGLKSDIPYYEYELIAPQEEVINARNINEQDYSSLSQRLEEEFNAIFEESSNYIKRTKTINLLNKYICLKGYLFAHTTGKIETSNDFAISNYIPVNAGDRIVPTRQLTRWFYDINKNPILYKDSTDATPDIASVDGYYRTSVYIENTHQFNLENGVVYISTGENDISQKTNIPYYEYELLDDINNIDNLTNIFKKVVCCGDSYTSGHIDLGNNELNKQAEQFSWPKYMSDLTGNEWLNAGKSGANVLTWQTDPLGYARVLNYGKAQAYLIGLMINDSGNSDWGHVDLGTIADIGTEAQTYYGGMSQIINKLIAINNKAKIFIQTCPSTDVSRYNSYNQAVRDIVAYYNDNGNNNIHCLDLVQYQEKYNSNSILNQDAINGHYTAIGYNIFATILKDILNKYISDNVDKFKDVAFIPYE